MTLAVIMFLIKYLKVFFSFSATGSIKKILNKLIFITIKIMKSKAEPGCLGLLIPYSNLTTQSTKIKLIQQRKTTFFTDSTQIFRMTVECLINSTTQKEYFSFLEQETEKQIVESDVLQKICKKAHSSACILLQL